MGIKHIFIRRFRIFTGRVEAFMLNVFLQKHRYLYFVQCTDKHIKI